MEGCPSLHHSNLVNDVAQSQNSVLPGFVRQFITTNRLLLVGFSNT